MNFFTRMISLFKENKSFSNLETKTEVSSSNQYDWISQMTKEWVLYRNFGTYYEMYRINVDIRSCVKRKRDFTWKWWIKIYLEWKDGTDTIQNDNTFVKAFFKNSWWEKKIIWEFIKHNDVSWNVFIRKIRNWAWKLIWIKILDSRYVTIVTDRSFNVIRYVYKKWWTFENVEAKDMYHYKEDIDFDNEMFWISLLETLVPDVYTDNESSLTNYYAYKNAWLPPAVIILKDWLKKEDANAAIEEIKSYVTWTKNTNKTLISNIVSSIETVAQTPKDMQSLELKWKITERVCAVMWVPKSVLNYTEGVNYTNWDTQFEIFVEQCVKTYENTISFVLQELLQDIIPSCKVDMVEDSTVSLSKLLTIWEKMVKNWFQTRNWVREQLLWLEKIENPMMDEITVESWVILIQDLQIQWIKNPNPQSSTDNQQ